FANLQGGGAVDTFTLTAPATSNIKGGGGVDVVALATNTLTGSIAGEVGGVSITGLGSAAIGTAGTNVGYNGTSANVSGGFTDATNLAGSGTLTGTANASDWSSITGTSRAYTDTRGPYTALFRSFANLQGGGAVDT